MLNKQQQYSQTKITNKVLLHRCSEDLSFKSIYHNDVEIQGSKLMKKHPQCLTEVSSRQIVRTYVLFFATWHLSNKSAIPRWRKGLPKFKVWCFTVQYVQFIYGHHLKKKEKKSHDDCNFLKSKGLAKLMNN